LMRCRRILRTCVVSVITASTFMDLPQRGQARGLPQVSDLLPLKEALKSPFLAAMRENHDLFKETEGGCALWKNREQVQALLGSRAACE